MPAVATHHTANGAFDFAAYYLKALDWSVATNDVYLLQQVSSPTCAACNRSIAGVRALLASGAYETGGRFDIESVRAVTGNFKIRSEYVFEAVTRDQAIVINRPSASPSTVAPALSHDASLIFVSWTRDGWNIVGVGAA